MLIGDLQRYLRDFYNRNVQKFGTKSDVNEVLKNLNNAYQASLQYRDSSADYARSFNELNEAQKEFVKTALKYSDWIGLQTFLNKLGSGNYPSWQKDLAKEIEIYYKRRNVQ